MPNPYSIEKEQNVENDTPTGVHYYIPQQSINPNVNKNNPYQVDKKKNEISLKKESRMDSYNISTQESFVISSNSNNKTSNILRRRKRRIKRRTKGRRKRRKKWRKNRRKKRWTKRRTERR